MLPDNPPWKLESLARLILGLILTVFFGALVAALVGQIAPAMPEEQLTFWKVAIAMPFVQIAAIVWIGFFLHFHGFGWIKGFGLNTKPLRALGLGLLAAALFFPAAQGLQWLSEQTMKMAHVEPKEQDAVKDIENPSRTLPQKILFGIAVIVLAPIFEESLFRGILYPAIKQRGHPKLAVWASSLLFAAAHLNVEASVPLFCLALVQVYLYESTNNLLAPIAAHALFNGTSFFLLVQQQPHLP